MEFFNQLNQDRKKTLIIVGVGLFGAIIFIALLIGIFSPVAKPKITATTKGSPASAATPGAVGFQTSPLPTQYAPIQEPSPTQELIFKEALKGDSESTPTPTPARGNFYIANGKQNDLKFELRYNGVDETFFEVQLINTKTKEVRIIGNAFWASPGDSTFFSKDFSQVIFLGGSKEDYLKISFYSIPLERVVKEITLADMKAALPALQLEETAILSMMVPSPDGKRVAISYGNTFDTNEELVISPTTQIMIIDLATKKMKLLPEKGLVYEWKDNSTLRYEISTPDPTSTVLEVTVN